MTVEDGLTRRLHWEKPSEGRFEELVGPDVIGLPNGLVWDSGQMLHADTYHRTITAYPTDAEGVPLSSPGQPARGQVAVKVPSSEGEMLTCSFSQAENFSAISDNW